MKSQAPSAARHPSTPLAALFVFCWALSVVHGGIIEMRDGYFWDPATTNYWIPRGFAYQTINPPVFATQTPEQIEYDFLEMKKMRAHSIRVDFTWGYIEPSEGAFDFTATDHIIATAEQYGLRLFPLIGYQYPPGWATNYDWMAVNQSNRTSNVLNYNHPGAQAAYTNFIARLTARYKDSPAIAGWILGNEYAYFDLWEAYDPHLFLGYDTNYSLGSFRNFLTNLYAGSVAGLNANWGTAYGSFAEVVMPVQYPADRHLPGYHDLIQWRKQSIGDFVAAGSLACRNADTNHLRSYSMVGGIYSGFDANNTCEDAKTIVARCLAAGAPLDFWSINNYAWALEGNELRTAQFGITKYQDQSGLPVLVTETGHSSTDNLFPGATPRQAAALPGQVWEALMAGAIGVHVFTWNDRPFGGSQIREFGFGIVRTNRLIKGAVYWNLLETFRRMEQVCVPRLFGASSHPDPDVYVYWGTDADMGWNRANQENCMLWGGLKRLGYEPRFIDETGLEADVYTNAAALVVSRGYQMAPERLDKLTNAIAQGVCLHANGDLPGQYNAYHASNAHWVARMDTLFGLNVSTAACTWHKGVAPFGGPDGWKEPYTPTAFAFTNSFGPLTPAYPWTNFSAWVIWKGIRATSGTTLVDRVRINGDTYNVDRIPALHVKDHAEGGRAAVNTYPLGDITAVWLDGLNLPVAFAWQVHYDWCRAIYRNWFGMTPEIDLSGSGYFYVAPDYRICTNGSVLISLLNESTNATVITLTASNLMFGKIVEQLSPMQGVLTTNSSGLLEVTLEGDEYRLLYAYDSGQSLANPADCKVWNVEEPLVLHPKGQPFDIELGYDTRGLTLDLFLAVESAREPHTEYGRTNLAGVTGIGTYTLPLPVAEADLSDTNYVSSHDGGAYRLHAWLEQGGTPVSECFLDTRLCWGARPAGLPSPVQTGTTYDITVLWQELPSYLPDEYPTPLSRADVWPSAQDDTTERYLVHLDLLNSNGISVVSSNVLTSVGTFSNLFAVTTPPTLPTPPYTWEARTVSYLWGANHDVVDSFEDRQQGDGGQFISPWIAFKYDQNGTIDIWAQGVDGDATDGTQGVFMVVNNPNPGGWSGFGLTWEFSKLWALPPASEWSNIWFAFDFKETNRVAGTVTMKVEDNRTPDAGALEYTAASIGQWQTLSNKLSAFSISAYPGTFDPDNVKKITVLLQTGTSTGLYLSHFDNIRFVGTTGEWMGAVSSGDLHFSYEDRAQGEWVSPAPWTDPASYPDGGSQAYVTHGIDDHASDGTNGHFFTYTSHTNVGGYSGIYELYTFSSSPVRSGDLASVEFSADFYEVDGDSCDLELQVKSASGQSAYSRAYAHTPGGWDHIAASLDQFSGDADMDNLTTLGFVVKMNTRSTEYACHLDNIRFTGTVSVVLSPVTNGLYLGLSETPPGTDTDGDGIPDLYETDTGIWNGPTDTGTDPLDPDSDDDGLWDGDEVIAGTDPNIASSVFTADDVAHTASGMVIEWFARTNRVYSVHYFDGSLLSSGPFNPLGTYTNITVPSDGPTNVVDAALDGITQRFYRVNVRME